MVITNVEYDECIKKSFFSNDNINGKFDPQYLSYNMIPYEKLKEFHYQTSFFLNFYASLYIELKKFESSINYVITKFTKTIENLGIIIDTTTTTYKLSTFIIDSTRDNNYNFKFYVKTFESKTANQNELYAYENTLSSSIAYEKVYSSIIDISRPVFGSNPITLVPNNPSNINYLLRKKLQTNYSYDYFNGSNLTKKNYLSYMPDNTSKFKEIIEEVFSQTPENIIGYLLYKKLYYNVILFNISIQNSIRFNYLNYYNNHITINNLNNNYKYIKFNISQRININKNITCDILIVGGGGGGGSYYGGGGGGGQVKYYTNNSFNNKNGDSIELISGEYNINIGNGGSAGNNGESSYIINPSSVKIIEAYGGGAGGTTRNRNLKGNTGRTIGGAGGAAGYSGNYHGNDWTSIGVNGGDGANSYGHGGGGGGGVRIDSSNNGIRGNYSEYSSYFRGNRGNGGYGLTIDITGTSIGYGGGGGGSGPPNIDFRNGRGVHGGGRGASQMASSEEHIATSGIANTGGGGGGGYNVFYDNYSTGDNYLGGSGGSGIIIIKYQDNHNDIIINKILSDNEIRYNENLNNSNIINTIKENKQNITELYKIHFIDNKNDYLLEKNNYINKLNILNNTKSEFYKTQEKLNISIKLYNEQYKKYNLYKNKSIYIIIVLIVIVISILLISVFPLFSNTTNNIIYIILLILLIILIYYIYSSNITEKFVDIGSATSPITIRDKQYNILTYNKFIPYINEYVNAYNDLLNNLRQNMYTIGSKSFSQDANIYLYNLYLEKKKLIESNNIKSTKLFNFIEIIKKHMNYLNNIILIISLFFIILLKSLIIYSILSISYIYIIIVAVILLIILMIYFTIVIIQPTRMVADKKYWASVNPSSKAIIRI